MTDTETLRLILFEIRTTNNLLRRLIERLDGYRELPRRDTTPEAPPTDPDPEAPI